MLSGTLTLLIFNPVFIPKYSFAFNYCAVCLAAQSCPALCDLMDSSPPGSSVYGDSLGKNTGVSCHALLQGIFSTQGSNQHLLRLPHWQETWEVLMIRPIKTTMRGEKNETPCCTQENGYK